MNRNKSGKSKNSKYYQMKQVRTISNHYDKPKSNKKQSKSKISHNNKTVQYSPIHEPKIKNRKQTMTQPAQTNCSKTKQKDASFINAVSIVFNNLDIDGNGVIGVTNINNIKNNVILYFLGSAFQKIKQKKLNLTLDHFILQCNKIKKESSIDDILLFIKAATSIDFVSHHRESLKKIIKSNANNIAKGEKMFNFQLKQFSNKHLKLDQAPNKDQILDIFYQPIKNDVYQIQVDDIECVPLQHHNFKKWKQTIPKKQDLKFEMQDLSECHKQKMQSPSFSYLSNQNNQKQQKKQLEVDTARLDRLNFKVEDYIKKNQERIKKSRNLFLYL